MKAATAIPPARLLRDASLAELLALLFGPADTNRLAEAAGIAAELAEETGAPLAILQLAALLPGLDRESWDAQRVAVFSVATAIDCPAFETAYFASEAHRQPHRMADLAGLFRAFGVIAQPAAGRPDDITVELEFLAFMLQKEALAIEHGGAPRVAQVRKGLRIFLTEHLGRWAPQLAERVRARGAGTIFMPVADLLDALISAQVARLGIPHIEPAPGFDPAAWESPRSHGPEFGVTSFVPLDTIPEVAAP